MLLAGLGQRVAKDLKLRVNDMKIVRKYEYHGYRINVYEDNSCDITDYWTDELVDGGFEDNKIAEQYILDSIE